ncbi:MAG TPA: tyrosine-type recombinase/integrase [Mycobacteriales bacterium]|nr:tyrosine-type recombinase/integrase [Mycobacteriales bacterium]
MTSMLARWPVLAAHAPTSTRTMLRYLDQIAVSLTPGSVVSTGTSLRTFGTFLLLEHPTVGAIAQLQRVHLEDYKRWLASDLDRVPLSATTRSMRLGALRMFFQWGWDDAPIRPLLFLGDLPRRDQPLPKALDDTDAARFLRAAQEQDRLLIRVVVEVLLRTGLRVGELCRLEADAIRTGVDGFWLHVPVGKLHDDRYLPLHPTLVGLIGDYRDRHVTPGHRLLIPHETGRPLNNTAVARMLAKVANRAGVGHVHPHKLRHTLATQAINRGMSMEAIAALLGHHSLDMTRRTHPRPHRRRRLLHRRRQSRRPLRHSPPGAATDRTASRDERPTARQRLLHPAPTARLRTRQRLRELRLLPNHHRVPTHPASPTRRRRREEPDGPSAAVQRAPRPGRQGRSIMNPLTNITHISPVLKRHFGRRSPDTAGTSIR